MSTYMKIEDNQDSKQARRLIKTLLETQKGKEFDGIQAMRFFRETWGIYADHHLFTEIMDEMTRTGQAACTQPWGFTKYLIN